MSSHGTGTQSNPEIRIRMQRPQHDACRPVPTIVMKPFQYSILQMKGMLLSVAQEAPEMHCMPMGLTLWNARNVPS